MNSLCKIAMKASKCLLSISVLTTGPWQGVQRAKPVGRPHLSCAVRGLPPWPIGKESTCVSGDTGDRGSLGRSHGEGNGNPLQYSYLENLHGQKSLAGYSPCGHKESDMTERAHSLHYPPDKFVYSCSTITQSFLLWPNIHNIKFTILTMFKSTLQWH